MRKFKIRASAAQQILGGVNRPTALQLQLIETLEAKKAAKGITEKQQQTLTDLITRRDAKPELSQGAKTYCETWLKEQPELYNRRKQFSNKYTEKGNICEPDGIAMICERMGYGNLKKNEQYFEDEYFTGTPDLLPPDLDIVEENKSSWNEQTFPLFETTLPTPDYYTQTDIYAHLTGRSKFAINYCLIDAPTEMIDQAALWEKKRRGMDDVTMELWDEIAASMTYQDVHPSLRFKRYLFDKDEALIADLQQRVIMCRDYIAYLLETRKFEFSKLVSSQPK